MNETSLSLLQRARRTDDRESWERLCAIYRPLLLRWIARHDVRPADMEDLAQDVLVVVARELPAFEHAGRPGAFRSWLRTILANRLRAFWRSRQKRAGAVGGSDFHRLLSELEDPASKLSRRWEREHDRELLRRLLELIEPRFAATTLLAFRGTAIEGRPPAEVAGGLGITVNAVLVAKCRVMKELRREGKGLLGE